MNKKTLCLCTIILATSMIKTNCGIFNQFDKHFSRMQQEMEKMRTSFANWQSNIKDEDFFGGIKIGTQKSRINIDQRDDKTIISLDLGKDIKEFDAKIKTKKEGFSQDQLVITMQEPTKGKIIISVNGRHLSINQSMQTRSEKQEEKKDDKAETQHTVSYQSSSFCTGQTLEHALNIDETNITYDDKEGILLIEIPTIKEEDKTKKIEVKIKK